MIGSCTSLNLYYSEVGKFDLLTREQEKELAKQVKRGGETKKAAVDKLVTSNLRLVVKIAQEFQGRGLDLEDLINEGNTGLFTAAKKFDPEKGARFSYYSSFWIRQSILRAISNNGRLIRIPVGSLEKYFKIAAYISHCKNRRGETTPSNEIIAKKFKLTEKRVAQILEAVGSVLPLDAKVGGEGEAKIHDVIPDEEKRRPDTSLEERERFAELRASVKTLPKREKFIIENRFGLNGDRQTLKSLGLKLKITKERVRQLESTALDKLKTLAKKKTTST